MITGIMDKEQAEGANGSIPKIKWKDCVFRHFQQLGKPNWQRFVKDRRVVEKVVEEAKTLKDTNCIICEASYLNDRHGEEWILCQSCDLWGDTSCLDWKIVQLALCCTCTIGSTQSTHSGAHNEFENISDAQEALWFMRENMENPSCPKKKRLKSRDFSKERTYTKYPSEIDLYQYRRQYHQEPIYGHHRQKTPVEDYHGLPIQSGSNCGSTLRRSRSLAVTREDIYTDLQNISSQQQAAKNRRSQLIPRARLIDKGSFKDRPTYHYQEHRYSNYGSTECIPYPEKIEKVQPILTSWPSSDIIPSYPQFKSSEEVEEGEPENPSATKSHNPSEIDSLDSNFQKHGLNLPNYYPDSIYDTDISLSHNSILDNEDKDSLQNNYPSLPDINVTLCESEKEFEVRSKVFDQAVEENFSDTSSGDEFVEIPLDEPPKQELVYSEVEFKPKVVKTDLKVNAEPEKLNSKVKNFINKNFISPFKDSKLISTEPYVATILENQYYSLPDVTISKSLRKCARIDAKLRQIDQKNRFVVNIGPIEVDEVDQEKQQIAEELRENIEKYVIRNQVVAKPIEIATKCKITTNKLDGIETPILNLDTFQDEINVSSMVIANNDKITIKIESKVDEEPKIEEEPKKEEIETPVEIKVEEPPIEKSKNKAKRIDSCKLYNKTKIKFSGGKKHNDEMPRPQIVHVTDATKSHQYVAPSNDATANDVVITSEFEDKLNSVKTYWDKMIDKSEEIPPTTKTIEHNKPKITEEIPKVAEKNVVVETCWSDKKADNVVQVKIEDVRKIFEKKEEDVKEQMEEEPQSQVEQVRKMFEPPKVIESEETKMGTFIKESCSFFEKAYGTIKKPFTRERPALPQPENTNIEIIEKEQNQDKNPPQETNTHTQVRKTKSVDDNDDQEFDHIRYKIMKSNLFQKNIFSNHKKEAQFDGLMQYLQDYSFQELLVDNNVVIIEPVRTKFEPRQTSKATSNSTNSLPTRKISIVNKDKPKKGGGLRKHFFYHPIRVNRELIEEELPDPETVRKVRSFFEKEGKLFQKAKKPMRYLTVDTKWDSGSLSSGVSSGGSDFDSPKQQNDFEENEYVSQDVLKKIRECGTSITYYGGKVLDAQSAPVLSPQKIMQEISPAKRNNDYQGVKFKLVKSNSCSSRLELIGAEKLSTQKPKILANIEKLRADSRKQSDSFKSTEFIDKRNNSQKFGEMIFEEFEVADSLK